MAATRVPGPVRTRALPSEPGDGTRLPLRRGAGHFRSRLLGTPTLTNARAADHFCARGGRPRPGSFPPGASAPGPRDEEGLRVRALSPGACAPHPAQRPPPSLLLAWEEAEAASPDLGPALGSGAGAPGSWLPTSLLGVRGRQQQIQSSFYLVRYSFISESSVKMS